MDSCCVMHCYARSVCVLRADGTRHARGRGTRRGRAADTAGPRAVEYTHKSGVRSQHPRQCVCVCVCHGPTGRGTRTGHTSGVESWKSRAAPKPSRRWLRPAMDDAPVCAICMDTLDANEAFRTSCCLQPFHPTCLEAYKQQRGRSEPGLFAPSLAQCPLCRSDKATGLTPSVWARTRPIVSLTRTPARLKLTADARSMVGALFDQEPPAADEVAVLRHTGAKRMVAILNDPALCSSMWDDDALDRLANLAKAFPPELVVKCLAQSCSERYVKLIRHVASQLASYFGSM
jgi:hypothetical protein